MANGKIKQSPSASKMKMAGAKKASGTGSNHKGKKAPVTGPSLRPRDAGGKV